MDKKVDAKLPEFVVKVLDEKELLKVTGGLAPSTANTKSQCNVDGTNDSD